VPFDLKGHNFKATASWLKFIIFLAAKIQMVELKGITIF
jgi:hypothetical protein